VLETGGAGKRNRTTDLRITNALLYQLSYSGKPDVIVAVGKIVVLLMPLI
jgi:hypothetical protein